MRTVRLTRVAPAPAATVISIHDNRYAPAAIGVPVGSSVTWVSDGLNLHTVTALYGTFDSSTLLPGERWTRTFSEPGQFRYICRQHVLSGMVGTITVR